MMSSVSRETRLDRYRALLLRWNTSINLVSGVGEAGQRIDHHINDSLALVPYLPPGLTRLIDLGSGQGFPAIPVAIATDVVVELIESDRRKAAFLTTVLASLGLNGRVHTNRIEQTDLAAASCVTARALAPLTQLLTLARPLVAPRGCCLFLKGVGAAQEIEDARHHCDFDAEVLPTRSSTSNLVKVTRLG